MRSQKRLDFMPTPDWWPNAEPHIHEAVEDFAAWARHKIATVPAYKLIEKNPFLFRARAPENAKQLADRLIDAFLSSSEETRFGDILEDIAIAVCRAAKGGSKSSSQGIDLEYDENGLRTIAQVKSSRNWGNSSQRKRLVSDFQAATTRLHQGGVRARCVEGICYGPSGSTHVGSHLKIIGNAFWFDISGWKRTGKEVFGIIEFHAANGLSDARNVARTGVVEYFRKTGCASKKGKIKWGKVYDLIMTPTRDRPR